MEADDPTILFKGEVQLAGWSETHNNGVKVTFWLQDDQELEAFRRITVRKGKTAGQIMMMVLVQVEDGQPVRQPKKTASSSAHLMLMGNLFLTYCRETLQGAEDWQSLDCRNWAKAQIGVTSLSELDSNPQALVRFHNTISRPFNEWVETGGHEEAGDETDTD